MPHPEETLTMPYLVEGEELAADDNEPGARVAATTPVGETNP